MGLGSPRFTCLFAWFMVDIPQPRRGGTMSNPWWSCAQHSETWGEANPTTSNLGEVALWVTPGAAQRNLGSRNLGPEAPLHRSLGEATP